MKLDETIEYYSEAAKQKEMTAKQNRECGGFICQIEAAYCEQRAEEYMQVVKWLEELKYYRKADLNVPLTWDELKTMIGKPFWLEKEYNFDMLNEKSKIGQWVVIESAPKNIHDNYYIFLTNNDVLDKNDMNKRWKAYRKENQNETD